MKIPRVEKMQSNNGNDVPNQFLIYTEEGTYFQSYFSLIAYKPFGGKIQLDKDRWNISRTTGKYRNRFLRETQKETQRKIDSGEYELVDLNR